MEFFQRSNENESTIRIGTQIKRSSSKYDRKQTIIGIIIYWCVRSWFNILKFSKKKFGTKECNCEKRMSLWMASTNGLICKRFGARYKSTPFQIENRGSFLFILIMSNNQLIFILIPWFSKPLRQQTDSSRTPYMNEIHGPLTYIGLFMKRFNLFANGNER